MLQYENLIDTLDRFQTAVFLKDARGRYLSMNTTGINFMKGHNGNVLGRTAHDLFDLTTANQMVESDQRVMLLPRLHTATLNSKDRISGAPLHMFSAKAAIRAPSGSPLGTIGISLVDCKDAGLFSEVCRMLPVFLQKKQPQLIHELLEMRTVSQFLRTHYLQ